MSDNIHRGSDFNDFLNKEIAKESGPNKQKWLCDKIGGDWLDKDCIIEITLIECLRHYVEVEKGLKNPADYQEEIAKGLIGNKRLAKLQEVYDDLSSAYEYIITKYDKRNEGMKDLTVRQMLEAADKKQKEIDDVVAKIWKHRKEMWT
jgi:hypothetical protein